VSTQHDTATDPQGQACLRPPPIATLSVGAFKRDQRFGSFFAAAGRVRSPWQLRRRAQRLGGWAFGLYSATAPIDPLEAVA
jgi:hypothetical protein